MKRLLCGCCGTGFKTWQGYIDQDQDKGYGICKDCQGWISDKDRAEMDKSIALLSGALSDDNRAKFEAKPREIQEYLVGMAFKDGFLTYSIGGRP